MNPEIHLIILPPAGWLLWTWGGFNFRPARWAVWPFVAAFFTSAVLGIGCGVGLLISMAVTLSAGYGLKSELHLALKNAVLVEVLAGLAYGLSLLWVGFNFWTAAIIVYVPVAFRLSRAWWPTWTHKYVEGFTGLLQGLAIAKRLAGV